jgi:hypothetical protein
LSNEVKNMSVETNVKTEIIEQAANLGDAKVPVVISDNDKKEVIKLYREGFIKTYSQVMRISAALALMGVLVAFVFIKNENLKIEVLKNGN